MRLVSLYLAVFLLLGGLIGCSGSSTEKTPIVAGPPPENSGEDIKAGKKGRFPPPPPK